MVKTRLLITVMTLVLLCAGCGGSGGGSDNGGGKSEETYGVSGQITLGGAVLPGVTVILSGAGSAETTTDSTGAYSFTNLANSEYTVTPSLTGYTFTPASAHVTVAGGIVNQDFTAVVNGISGQVTLGGTAIAGVTVILSGAGSAETTTDSTGAYSFTRLAGGDYAVTPSLSRCSFTPVSADITITGGNVTQAFTAMVNHAIAAGTVHSLALKSDGTVWALGYNAHGQLGDGTTTTRLVPVRVTGLAGVISIASGAHHSLALKSDGTVWVWGYNDYGQLGDGTMTDRHTPVPLSGLSDATAITAGVIHSLALTRSGGVKAWGDNLDGQLGDGTTTTRLTPVDVSGLTSGVASIAAGAYHSLCLTSSGGVKAWGWNVYGQLGDGTNQNRSIPVDVSGLTSGATAVAAGSHFSLVLTGSNGVKSWGWNYYGQLGDGTNTDRSTPVDVSGLTSGITAITAGNFHSLALTSGGGVKAWGYNSFGQLGDNSITDRSMPVDVSGLTSGVIATSAGGLHSLALMSGGGLKAWGSNSCGQLGSNSTTDRHAPGDVISLSEGHSHGSHVQIFAH